MTQAVVEVPVGSSLVRTASHVDQAHARSQSVLAVRSTLRVPTPLPRVPGGRRSLLREEDVAVSGMATPQARVDVVVEVVVRRVPRRVVQQEPQGKDLLVVLARALAVTTQWVEVAG